MTFVSVFYGWLFYFATFILIGGVARKVYQYWKIPAPLKIPTTPAPLTKRGVVGRLLREVLLFESLFRANKTIWLFAFLFHMALWLVLLRHSRYVVETGIFLNFIQPFGKYASFVMVFGLAGLWVRRIVVDRVRYISSPSDHLMLALLLGIALSGMLMTFVVPTDIVQVKAFFRGLLFFNWHNLPAAPILLVHLFLVAILMLVFPVSKLLHAPGIFFSPTRNQVDNPREKRHIAPWALELEKQNKLYLDEVRRG
ncbi:respiratory nitrate reductase subunit gamma [Thiofilum flexile]|uniref:respiratory nitrate reductase subunit gamma n=1 Tax=Thiofilum flexile TaxID=125627 RepID=UPI0003809B76|nr:respiratory nitrate reductase subunit gamma [Thiofilum flexile]